MGAPPQQVAEVAQGMSVDDLAVVDRLEEPAVALLHRDIEVVGPELDHHFVQLPAAVHLPQDRRPAQFPDDVVAVPDAARSLASRESELNGRTRISAAVSATCRGANCSSIQPETPIEAASKRSAAVGPKVRRWRARNEPGISAGQARLGRNGSARRA